MIMINRFIAFISSIRLCLASILLLFVLVLIGTFSQLEHGIFYVQETYFHSWFLYYSFNSIEIPVFPGGALVGTVLIVNLIFATLFRLQWSIKKTGLVLVHFGLIALFIGSGITSCVSSESQIYLKEQDSTFYSKDMHDSELVIIDSSSSYSDFIVAIPFDILNSSDTVTHKDLPFTVTVHETFENAQLALLSPSDPRQFSSGRGITEGLGQKLSVTAIPSFTRDDMKNNPTAIVSFSAENFETGNYLISLDINGMQVVTFNGKSYYIQLRAKRYYFPFTMTLKTFTETLYPGSTIAKAYSSLVEIAPFQASEPRDVLIYMNHPFRYDDYTFYQASFGQDEPSSILQVVYNPSWYIPYISCLVIAVGMCIHFFVHLVLFMRRSRS